MAKRNGGFRHGRSTFSCLVCRRLTRETDVNGSTDCCPQCYELGGYDNMFNDDGRKPTEKELAACNALLAEVVAKGGDGKRVKDGCDYIWPADGVAS